MSHQSLDLGETSSPSHGDREDYSGSDSPYARAEPPPAAVDDSAQDGRSNSPELEDYDDLVSGQASSPPNSPAHKEYDNVDSGQASPPDRSPSAANGADKGSPDNILVADEFLESMSGLLPASQANTSLGEANEEFEAAYTGATRGIWAKINSTSRDDLTRKYRT